MNIISAVGICVIVLILAFIYPEFSKAASLLTFPQYDIYRSIIATGLIMVGVLIELQRLIHAFKIGFCIKKISLILSLLLTAIIFIPFSFGSEITGNGLYYTIFQNGIFRSVLSMIAGIGLVRSITK